MMKRIFVSFILLLLLSGCTKASSKVKLLSEILSFSSVSTNPFQQDNPGRYLILSGYCLPGVTEFDFRLDENPIWSQIPNTPPAPDTSSGESAPPAFIYDTDCSDGQYSFYIFESDAMDNYTANGDTDLSDNDPYKIELRVLPASLDLPAITFMRPPPYTFLVETVNGGFPQNYELDSKVKFKITLMNAYGEDTRPLDTDVKAYITNYFYNNTGPATLLDSDCATPIPYVTFSSAGAGDREKEFCLFMDSSVISVASPPNYFTLMAASDTAGMVSFNSSLLQIFPNYSAQMLVFSEASNSIFPPYIVKGAIYKFTAELLPLYVPDYPLDRIMEGFTGTFDISAPGAYLQPDPQPSPLAGSFSETMASLYMSYTLTVDPSATISSLNLAAIATPDASCTNCNIQENNSDTSTSVSHAVSAYVANRANWQVVSGDTTVTQPFFDPFPNSNDSDAYTKAGRCEVGIIAGANAQNQIVPIPVTSVQFTISSENSDVEIFDFEGDCSATYSASQIYYLPRYSTGQRFSYRVPTLPASGKVKFIISDGTSQWVQEVSVHAPESSY